MPTQRRHQYLALVKIIQKVHPSPVKCLATECFLPNKLPFVTELMGHFKIMYPNCTCEDISSFSETTGCFFSYLSGKMYK